MYLKNSQAVGDFTFERVSNCKYLGIILINKQTNSFEEINGIKCRGYFLLVPLFMSK
jgi:hypothetical protein